ncbi:LOW QUALITY PROTEIN: hypothetical protein E2986_13314 [Frieseomelitta varia]|uniref:Uncharacterized protein n=1 Tax=Frieseomelitta varia TaxID=561572 RepID=A0A833VZV0_9HYME|nr:LOW QUALITY PROTEIN: hypothetical protein E2986_13314 [Frieseomelitta varia]
MCYARHSSAKGLSRHMLRNIIGEEAKLTDGRVFNRWQEIICTGMMKYYSRYSYANNILQRSQTEPKLGYLQSVVFATGHQLNIDLTNIQKTDDRLITPFEIPLRLIVSSLNKMYQDLLNNVI